MILSSYKAAVFVWAWSRIFIQQSHLTMHFSEHVSVDKWHFWSTTPDFRPPLGWGLGTYPPRTTGGNCNGIFLSSCIFSFGSGFRGFPPLSMIRTWFFFPFSFSGSLCVSSLTWEIAALLADLVLIDLTLSQSLPPQPWTTLYWTRSHPMGSLSCCVRAGASCLAISLPPCIMCFPNRDMVLSHMSSCQGITGKMNFSYSLKKKNRVTHLPILPVLTVALNCHL